MHSDPNLKLKKCIEDAYGMANFLRGTAFFNRRGNIFDSPSSQPRFCTR